MHPFLSILLGIAAVFWVVYGGHCLIQMQRIPRLASFPPDPADSATPVSVLMAARDEAAGLPQALPTLLAETHPRFEVIAVDDRSRDSTGSILDDFARRDRRLRVLHIRELPAGWLGKVYALQTAYEQSHGEWLLFTDADVRFGPEAISRALRLARERNLDHLTLLASLEMRGFWEHATLNYIALAFLLGIRPWRVDKQSAGSYMGIGAFQLVRRSAYEVAGGHRRLAMEVVDDMKLGKIMKSGGFRSAVAIADGYVRIRWQDGLGNIVRGLTKNMFAGMSFRIWKAVGTFVAALLLSVLPFLALAFTRGAALDLAIAASAGAVLCSAAVLVGIGGESPLYGLAHPFGAGLFAWIAVRSMVVTLWRGGIVWRDTFYPLDELRRGAV
ncbi:MAG TPA: glycosyltransferase [Patescibacteria group bacterium]|nr:glycosyltransferase [Patescibacteria group bacterium]